MPSAIPGPNPGERLMAIWNIALQNCALERSFSTEEIEESLRKCNSMAAVGNVKLPQVQLQWLESMKEPIEIVQNRFKRMALKEEPITCVP